MIVGLSGKKQSGKNLVAKIWQALDTHYNYDYGSDNMAENAVVKMITGKMAIHTSWQQKSFAYKLKQIVCLLIGCTMEQLEDEEFKNKELGEEWRKWICISSPSGWFNTKEEAIKDAEYYYDYVKQNPKRYEMSYKDIIQKSVISKIFTPRFLLQEIGTNCFRDIIHPNIWINSLFSDYKSKMACITDENDWNGVCYDVDVYPNWLITDVRFKNEAESILDREGLLIRVNRFCYDSAEDFCVCNPDKEISKQGIHIVSNFSGDEFVQRINKLALDNGYISLKEQHTSETDLDEYDKFNYIIDNTGSIENLIEEVKEIMIKEGFINGE